MAKRKAKVTPKNPTAEGLRNIAKMAKRAYAGNQAYKAAKKQYAYDKFTGNKEGMKEFHTKYGIPFGSNDLSWYNNYPELVNGLITPNFMSRKGTSADYPEAGCGIPSVAGLTLTAVRGANRQGVIDASINKLLTSLRMANTGAQQYTTLDLDHYIYNVRAALICIRQLRRIYGLITKFSTLDSTLPEAFFLAMNIPYDTFKDNSANLRMFLNYSAERLHVITPIKNDLMERTAWLCDYIFKDSDDAKVQYYVPYFPKIYYYDYTLGYYVAINFYGAQPYTYFISQIQNLIDNLISTNVNGIIASDILKAFGSDQMKYFDYIDENYKTSEVYSEEVLQQIQNASMWGSITYNVADGSNFIIENIQHDFTVSATNPTLYNLINNIVGSKKINFYKDNISTLDVVGATRLTYLGDKSSDSNTNIYITSYGTEILEGMRIIHNLNGTLNAVIVNWMTFLANTWTTSAQISNLQRVMSFWTCFDWAPELLFLYWAGFDSSGTTVSNNSDLSLFDCNNVAKFTTNQQLLDVHNVANMSLYYSPYMIRDTRVTKLPEAGK